jgi:hypothetical protein
MENKRRLAFGELVKSAALFIGTDELCECSL